jgi:hypothetical protein
VLPERVTWPNPGIWEFGCIRVAWLACATWLSQVVAKLRQLFSGQLPTNIARATRFHDVQLFCRFGCQSLEDPHHLFVHCHFFDNLRCEYLTSLKSETDRVLSDLTLPVSITSHLGHVINHLFRDDSCWPLHSSRFYLGLLPPLLPHTVSQKTLSGDFQRLLTRIAQACHSSAIRLAARIWGIIVRHYSEAKGGPKRRNKESVLQNSNLSLPGHLNYLLSL